MGLTIIQDVAVLGYDNPPVNALSSHAVRAFTEAFAAEAADPAIVAIVIHGAGRMFSAGADIAEFGDRPDDEVAALRALIDRLDAVEKPVVMALHKAALGGGLELALAGHYRLATPDTSIGLPEVTLGLLPGAGGTQRLPRLAGVPTALSVIMGGRPMTAATAVTAGIIDEVTTTDLLERAVAVALSLVGQPPRRASGLAVPPCDLARILGDARTGLDPRLRGDAPAHIIDCLEAAATLPFAAGLALEYRLVAALILSETSRGLRHAFLGQRLVAHIPGLPKTLETLPTDRCAVIGGGTMGVGITIALLNAGVPVTLVEQAGDNLERAVARITRTIEADVSRGRITAATAADRITRLSPTLAMADAGAADLIIEAVFEDIDVKQAVFEKLDAIARPGAILASNTSTLDVDRIAAFTRRPDHVVGLHFFSPANIMKLLEVVRGAQTAPDVLATVLGFARRINKIGVVAGVCDGFIGNRIFEEYLRQSYFMLEEGALPHEIDDAMEAWGWAMGPLRVMDLAGQDIGWNIRKRRAVEQPDRPYSAIPDLICEQGRFGQKTGAGFYLYPQGSRRGVPDPTIEALVVAQSDKLGIVRRPITAEEIVARCHAAMVNEAARILAEGIAYRPADIDVVYLNGYGFPATRGGPLFYADRIGLSEMLGRIATYRKGYQGWAWEPAPLLAELARNGQDFGTLNSKK